MKNRVCIVTGATRGIGRAVLGRFVREGAKVIGTYQTSQSEAENMTMDMPIDMYRLDIRKRTDIQNFMVHIGQIYERVDVIVNNAGYWEAGDLSSMKTGQVDDMFNTHCHGPMWMVKYARKLLSRNSSIVNVASNGALRGGTDAPHYAAAKAALLSWTRSLSKILAPFTRVNAVAGGIIDTGMLDADTPLEGIPLQRWGTTDDMADAIEFLASDRSSYITGQTLVVDGGQYV